MSRIDTKNVELKLVNSIRPTSIVFIYTMIIFRLYPLCKTKTTLIFFFLEAKGVHLCENYLNIRYAHAH